MAKNLFNSIQVKRPRTNVFDLSHDVKMSCKMGNLTPVMCMEVIPSDSVRISNEVMLRFAPLIAPVMHRFDVSVHYFFVPNRILWDGWGDFISGNMPDSQTPALPKLTINAANNPVGSLPDHLGLPQTVGEYEVSALPLAAYQAVYHEYYRDQNLIDSFDYTLEDGDNSERPDVGEFFTLRKRAWQHDYFTAALPWAQKGDEVTLPIGSFADVSVYAERPPSPQIVGGIWHPVSSTKEWPNPAAGEGTIAGVQDSFDTTQGFASAEDLTEGAFATYYDPNGTLRARTSDLEAEAATINNLRRAFRLQEWLEKNARGGTRYTENIQAHFGVRPQDSRLQRPEYIGGSKQPVSVSEVLNTAGGERPQGDMAGHGVSVGAGHRMKYYAQEHGYIIGMMSVMPKPAYQQGVPRHFLKDDRFMYYWPTFAHIGEQEVLNQELYVDHEEPNDTFGYVPRYAEYKYIPSRVAGDFKTTLNYWHLGRIFDNAPALNQDFIEVDPDDLTRIFAVETEEEDNLWCHVFHRVTAKRPMPKFGTPSF